MTDDIETIDHTARYLHKLQEINGLPLRDLASALYVALHAEHDLVIRLHERLMMARRHISIVNNTNCGQHDE